MEAHPKDIVWANLDDGALEMTSRYVTSWMASFAMIVAWTFPVGFVGTLSNLDDLCVKVQYVVLSSLLARRSLNAYHVNCSWLAWVCTGTDTVLLLAHLTIELNFHQHRVPGRVLYRVSFHLCFWLSCLPLYPLFCVVCLSTLFPLTHVDRHLGLAWYECIPRYSLMSISVYRRFYFFLLV